RAQHGRRVVDAFLQLPQVNPDRHPDPFGRTGVRPERLDPAPDLVQPVLESVADDLLEQLGLGAEVERQTALPQAGHLGDVGQAGRGVPVDPQNPGARVQDPQPGTGSLPEFSARRFSARRFSARRFSARRFSARQFSARAFSAPPADRPADRPAVLAALESGRVAVHRREPEVHTYLTLLSTTITRAVPLTA